MIETVVLFVTVCGVLEAGVEADRKPQLLPSPLILVPGLGGSRLHAKIDKTREEFSHGPCGKKFSERSKLWLSYDIINPWKRDCWLDNMRLVFNEQSGKVEDSPGVDVTAEGFGDTAGIEDLSKTRLKSFHYFSEIINKAVAWGYEKGKTIFGAPYDWRRAPNEHGEYYRKLKGLIERTVKSTGRKVSILAHSNGCMMTLYFLQRQPLEWKRDHILQLFSVAGAYGGTPKALHGLVSGLDDIVMLPALKYRKLQRTWPSVYFNLPRPGIGVWGDNEVLLQTPSRSYTVNDYEQLFEDMNFTEGKQQYKAVKDIMDPFVAPNVKVHCITVEGRPTTSSLTYHHKNHKFPNQQPKAKLEDGDSYIPSRSSSFCERWDKDFTHVVRPAKFTNTHHSGILTDKMLFHYLKGRLFIAQTD